MELNAPRCGRPGHYGVLLRRFGQHVLGIHRLQDTGKRSYCRVAVESRCDSCECVIDPQAQILAACRDEMNATRSAVQPLLALAAAFGLKVVTYEGGPYLMEQSAIASGSFTRTPPGGPRDCVSL